MRVLRRVTHSQSVPALPQALKLKPLATENAWLGKRDRRSAILWGLSVPLSHLRRNERDVSCALAVLEGHLNERTAFTIVAALA